MTLSCTHMPNTCCCAWHTDETNNNSSARILILIRNFQFTFRLRFFPVCRLFCAAQGSGWVSEWWRAPDSCLSLHYLFPLRRNKFHGKMLQSIWNKYTHIYNVVISLHKFLEKHSIILLALVNIISLSACTWIFARFPWGLLLFVLINR